VFASFLVASRNASPHGLLVSAVAIYATRLQLVEQQGGAATTALNRPTRSVENQPLPGLADGMPDECVVSLDNTTLMPKAFLRERICVLGPDRMSEICEALAIATGCR